MPTQKKTFKARGDRSPVSARALSQRIQRVLGKKDELLKATRGERFRRELGDYYTVDVSRNVITQKHVNLEDLGRKLKVLEPWEKLV